MSAWFNSLSQLQRIFALIAIPSTVVMLIQSLLLVMGIVGGDSDGDGIIDMDDSETDGGTDSEGLSMFSIRGFVAMFSVGGWLGIVLLDAGMQPLEAIILAFVGGVAALYGITFLVRLLLKLQSSGNIDIANAVGKTGTVYLTIPGKMAGTGKIHIVLQETYTEFGAVTSDTEDIKTGESIKVTAVNEAGILEVSRLTQTKTESKETTEETII